MRRQRCLCPCAHGYQLQTAADPFQPAKVSNHGAQNGATKQKFEEAGKMKGHNCDEKQRVL